jgi:hypothetical protein
LANHSLKLTGLPQRLLGEGTFNNAGGYWGALLLTRQQLSFSLGHKKINKMTLFNSIGEVYNTTKVADGRIVSELIRLMDLEKNSIRKQE